MALNWSRAEVEANGSFILGDARRQLHHPSLHAYRGGAPPDASPPRPIASAFTFMVTALNYPGSRAAATARRDRDFRIIRRIV